MTFRFFSRIIGKKIQKQDLTKKTNRRTHIQTNHFFIFLEDKKILTRLA